MIFKISHEAKTFENSWQQLQYRPYQKHDTPTKGLFSNGFAAREPIAEDSYRSNPCGLDLSLAGKESMISGCMLYTSTSPQICETQ